MAGVTYGNSHDIAISSGAGYTDNMKHFLVVIVLGLSLAVNLAIPVVVMAAPDTSTGSAVGLPNPIKCPDATCLVSQVIRYILGVIAVIATLMFIWGGVMMLTSGGNAEQVKKAKETLVWATIGILVILISWAVIRFVLAGIAGTTQ